MPKKGYSLGANPSHQRLMLRGLAASLFQHERVQTTEARAKLLRPYAERLVTKAKKGSVHHRRQVLSELEDREIVHKLFSEIGPRFAERNGGYTRILKIGPRNGDGAPMALIELVEGAAVTTVGSSATTSRRRRGRRRPAGRTEETAAPAAAATETAEEPEAELQLEDEVVDGGTTDVTGDEPVAQAQQAEDVSEDSEDESEDGESGDSSDSDDEPEKS